MIESLSDDTLIFHQVVKKVWPAAQRDSCFWSHIRAVDREDPDNPYPDWIVVNYSTKYLMISTHFLMILFIFIEDFFLKIILNRKNQQFFLQMIDNQIILIAFNLDLIAFKCSSVICFDGVPSTIVSIFDFIWKPSSSLFCSIERSCLRVTR